MKLVRKIRGTLWLGALLPVLAQAQVVFFELDQQENIFNRVQEGDGLEGLPGSTPGQFKTMHTFSGVAPVTGAEPMDPPRSGDGRLRIGHIRAGAPLYGRFTSYLFGQVLPLPDTDEDGIELDGVNASDYWNPRPFRESDRLGFAWDDIRKRVLATAAGTFDITWQKRQPEPQKPDDYDSNPEDYYVVSGVYYRLYSHSHAGISRGDAIAPPSVKEDRTTALDNTESNYWNAQPHDLRATERYHFSKSSNSVFATQPGPVNVIWQRLEPTAGNHSGDDDYIEVGGLFYRLYNKRYIISGSPVKAPKTMYWTEGEFHGVPVGIPETAISEVKVVYNSDVPRNVPVSEGTPLDQGSGIDTDTNGQGGVDSALTATLWYSPPDKSLKALNRQGRLFVEFLGAPNAITGIPEFLGFEIVDIVSRPIPKDRYVELGDQFPSFYHEESGERLQPRLANQQEGDKYVYQHFGSSDIASATDLENTVYYARRETTNLNDLIVWWLEKGVENTYWPKEYVRYDLKWPTSVNRYSQYVRPTAANENEAKETSVQLNGEEVPTIEYQDPLDENRAKITPDFRFYTYLTDDFPAHRTLLRFIAEDEVRFERVFSWLDESLAQVDGDGEFQSDILDESVATQLDSYDSDTKRFHWPDASAVANVFDKTVYVGDRLVAPQYSLGASEGAEYWAGYINLDKGDSINPNAYIDPFDAGFVEANRGAIIPVNSIPDDNALEVLWFRASDDDVTDGFTAHYWPSALGRYTIEWPTAPSEIVLASNDGSGPLSSLLAKGTIYYENDKSAIGYNPNEEHALMQGGQAFAIRDDLNVMTNVSGEYSSDPYVLVEYEDADERLSMKPYKVLREKLASKETFTYPVEAGTILQAPMPLPLMDLPLLESGESEGFNVSKEANWIRLANSDVQEPQTLQRWEFDSEELPILADGTVYNLQSADLSESKALYVSSSSYYDGTVEGVVGEEAFQLVSLSVTDGQNSGWGFAIGGNQNPNVYFQIENWSGDPSTLVEGEEYNLYLRDQGQLIALELVSNQGEGVDGVLAFAVPEEYRELTYLYDGQFYNEEELIELKENTPALFLLDIEALKLALPQRYRFNDLMYQDMDFVIVDPTMADGDLDGWYVSQSPLAPEDLVLNDYRSKFTFQDRKGNMWVYRGPHDKYGPAPTDAFSVQFYYKTLPGFYFPELGSDQPDVGTIVPYLRGKEADNSWAGDPVGNDDQALAISYQPYWPSQTPVLFTGETLTTPKRGLPAVRGQISAEVLYQQSERTDDQESVVLHDPTREKEFHLDPTSLEKIPGSAVTEDYLGMTYFSLLPPHLGERFFYDANRGEEGALVYRGKFQDETLGEDYLFLNILSESDRNVLKGLVVSNDEDKADWDAAIDSLTTTLETFVEDANRPGTYIPNTVQNKVVQVDELAAIGNDDIAVDSYALSAAGPGSGFVTMIFGNGEAFTPVGDPVVMQILQVTDELYRGQVKPVLSSNPLNEQLTMQQISDFAGAVEDYDFQWMIASPVDGLPPVVTENERVLLLGDDSWSHMRFPSVFDSAATVSSAPASRISVLATGSVKAIESVTFDSVLENGGTTEHEFTTSERDEIVYLDRFVMRDASDAEILGRVTSNSSLTALSIEATEEDAAGFVPVALEEQGGALVPSSIVFRDFTTDNALAASAVYLSMDLEQTLGARVFVNDVEVVLANMKELDVSLTNTSTTGAPAGFTTLTKVFQIPVEVLALGTPGADEMTHTVAVELYSNEVADTFQTFNLRIEAYDRIDFTEDNWIALDDSRFPDGVRTVLGQVADVRALADNYLIMRYRPKLLEDGSPREDDDVGGYSEWTTPALAEGWIKRVLAGINPFNQRVTNLFSNAIDSDASVLTEAGPRWEGDVALNLSTINDYGLIEIYETVLNRGRMLSIDAGINYGPANDALLLAAGYLNDLYMLLGDEAKADALNPTIGIGTANSTYGDVATSMFAFEGQVASLLEEELTLWRGRSDFLQPGVEISPVYNRFVWNYTRGIDSGEVIYALNYNIQEQQESGEIDGTINAEDAAVMYPQGHGDAYGHYLMALKNYYRLFMDEDFTWVPRIEAVNVLGVPVSVDYQDERKFAAAAVQLAKAGEQVVELTWRQDYEVVTEEGWSHLSNTRTNERRALPSTRYWGVDHWASRTQLGTYLNWVVGNSMLPETDEDTSHEGIQVVDRQTVTELRELTFIGENVQADLDNAEGGLNPLGLDKGSIAFDLDPDGFGLGETSHFEQILKRAELALNNAVIAFDDAKDVTRLMRSEEDSLNEFQAKIDAQELAYRNQLIEIYGTPYTDDIGPGKTYSTEYYGPDLVHYRYVDDPTIDFDGTFEKYETKNYTMRVIIPPSGEDAWAASGLQGRLDDNTVEIDFSLSPSGYHDKPDTWTGKRAYAGKLQMAINEISKRRDATYLQIENYQTYAYVLDRQLEIFLAKVNTMADIKGYNEEIRTLNSTAGFIRAGTTLAVRGMDAVLNKMQKITDVALTTVSNNLVVGLANGGDVLSAARGAIKAASVGGQSILSAVKVITEIAGEGAAKGVEVAAKDIQFNEIVPAEILLAETESVYAVDAALQDLNGQIWPVNRSLQEWHGAVLQYEALEAKGRSIQAEREVFRKRSAAVVQGYRTRNAAFRLFRNEKLERYKDLFDLASRYAFLAAQAFDYETGLLGTEEGADFIGRIIQSRALGVVQDGEPQFAGSDQGDPGISSILAEMSADWEVLKSRLGFNNPDVYGTTFSLREERFRILPGAEGNDDWQDVLEAGRVPDLLEDPDVRRYAMQIDTGDGLPVPGIVIEFSTNISNGLNFLGRNLAAGDHSFSPTSFATKIHSSGIVFEGYKGMDTPNLNVGAVVGASSPSDPDLSFLDEDALAATPYVYLIPVGKDVMRTPPLGDQSVLRGWDVQDVTIPLPFNVGASEHSSKAFYQSRDSLSEPLFSVRKHQAFRPVSTESVYEGDNGRLFSSEFTNSRLIGRSVWNTKWKLIIPGRTLLNDADEGLERFIDSVTDIKLHLDTYSYSGN